MNTTKITYLAAALATVSANAFAQGYTMQAVPPAPAAEPAPVAMMAPAPVAGASDHSAVVGHMGVGYMGAKDVPLSGGKGAPAGKQTAPVIGVRYWLNEKMGLDLGLGLSLSGGGSTVTDKNDTSSEDKPGAFAVLLHAGVPYVLTAKKHYNFQIVPEVNFGYASQTIVTPKTSTDQDQKLTGMRLDVGARAGTELHFGFMGVPQLALQGSVGMFLRYEHTGYSTKDYASNTSSTSVATSVGDKPWDIFTGNVSALYYF